MKATHLVLLSSLPWLGGCFICGENFPDEDSNSASDTDGLGTGPPSSSMQFEEVLVPSFEIGPGEAPEVTATLCFSPAPNFYSITFTGQTGLETPSEGGPPEVFVRMTDAAGTMTTLIDGPNESSEPRTYVYEVALFDPTDSTELCETGFSFVYDRIDPETTGVLTGDLMVAGSASWEGNEGEIVVTLSGPDAGGTGGSESGGSDSGGPDTGDPDGGSTAGDAMDTSGGGGSAGGSAGSGTAGGSGGTAGAGSAGSGAGTTAG